MNKTTKITTLIAALVLTVSLLASCAQEAGSGAVRVFYMNGSTGMAMAKIVSDNKADNESAKYAFSAFTAADQMTGDIIQGNFDIAAVPTPLALTLYKKTSGAVKVCAVTTLGVLYILDSTGEIKSVSDLAGKTIYTTGVGSVPQFVIETVLEANNIEASVEYAPEASTVMGDMVMLPEPYVSSYLAKHPEAVRALDMTKEYRSAVGSSLFQACVIVRAGFAEDDPEKLEAFMSELASSVEFVNSDTDEAAQAIVDAGIVASAKIAKSAIPGSNVVCVTGEKMKASLGTFFEKYTEMIDPDSAVKADDIADMFYTGR